MPTYDYKCRACEHRFEIQQSFTDDALTECPECGGELRKVFGAVGISFKGSGFYKNDSKSSKSSTTAKSSESTSSGSDSASGSGSGTGSSGTDKASTGSDSSSKGEASKPAPAATTP